MEKVIVYTDGACSGNPGPGGRAAVIIVGEVEIELKGGDPETTNQRMEMRAPLEALKSLKHPSRIEIYSDSAYVINAFEKGWLTRWEKNGWRTAAGDPVKNREIWEELRYHERKHEVTWHKVKGHSSDHYNDRCDQLARNAIPLNGENSKRPEASNEQGTIF